MLNHTYLLIFKIFVRTQLWPLKSVPFSNSNGGMEGISIRGKLLYPSPLSRPLKTPTIYTPPSTQHEILVFSTSFTYPPFKGILIRRAHGWNITTTKWGTLSLYKVSREGYWKITITSPTTLKTFSTHKWNDRLIARPKDRSQCSRQNPNRKNHTMD